VAGLLMIGMGNGAVMWASRIVPSGVVALIVSSVPLWMVLADWTGPSGVRPRAAELIGVIVGLAGIVVLVGPKAVVGQGDVNAIGAAVLVVGSISWAIGSIVTRRSPRPTAPLVSVALQMVAAGVALGVVAAASGEWRGFAPTAVPIRAVVSWLYLIFFGSIVGYTAYIYLLGAVSPAKASTYAYVNPVIAVFLGWALAGEALGPRTLLAAAVIIASVAIITAVKQRAVTAQG
jgi:drug/metabolite transporter (DMT)-like permease